MKRQRSHDFTLYTYTPMTQTERHNNTYREMNVVGLTALVLEDNILWERRRTAAMVRVKDSFGGNDLGGDFTVSYPRWTKPSSRRGHTQYSDIYSSCIHHEWRDIVIDKITWEDSRSNVDEFAMLCWNGNSFYRVLWTLCPPKRVAYVGLFWFT